MDAHIDKFGSTIVPLTLQEIVACYRSVILQDIGLQYVTTLGDAIMQLLPVDNWDLMILVRILTT